MALGIVLLAAVLVAALLAALLPGSHPASSDTASGTAPATASPSRSSGATNPAERRAARALAVLLPRSGADRVSVINAVVDLSRCGPHVARDAAVFRKDATSRHRLLARLAALPGRTALPARVVRALTRAWRASAQADADYAAWAASEAANGCHTNYAHNPYYRAAIGPDGRATAAKQEFVRFWNPLARRYGLTRYQPTQL